ncbi:hypothetical protein [Candidatus Thiosymbion oneisti]|uniref:hypothetical protein n=1 Tax=Candidatus Thiosymbion oneisti TaxID=589554 RepID=UPI00105C680A|nr:hypothetical protein [Candidatus Thiosymbion oneisti]
MDSGLLWSAPAKRRDRIEPQRRGIPAALAKNLGLGFHARRGDGAFPWPQRLAGDRGVAKSKAAAGLQCRLAPQAPAWEQTWSRRRRDLTLQRRLSASVGYSQRRSAPRSCVRGSGQDGIPTLERGNERGSRRLVAGDRRHFASTALKPPWKGFPNPLGGHQQGTST